MQSEQLSFLLAFPLLESQGGAVKFLQNFSKLYENLWRLNPLLGAPSRGFFKGWEKGKPVLSNVEFLDYVESEYLTQQIPEYANQCRHINIFYDSVCDIY
jgi:hypothetical protein